MGQPISRIDETQALEGFSEFRVTGLLRRTLFGNLFPEPIFPNKTRAVVEKLRRVAVPSDFSERLFLGENVDRQSGLFEDAGRNLSGNLERERLAVKATNELVVRTKRNFQKTGQDNFSEKVGSQFFSENGVHEPKITLS